jgi:hypothetical protein
MSSEPFNGGSGDPTGAEERNGTRNQALIRELNEQVWAFAANAPSHDEVLVICECSDVGCTSPVAMSPTDYELIRRSATRFVVKPGHIAPSGERVVEETSDYSVVEKLGDGAAIATRLDPRRAGV